MVIYTTTIKNDAERGVNILGVLAIHIVILEFDHEEDYRSGAPDRLLRRVIRMSRRGDESHRGEIRPGELPRDAG